MTGDWLEMGGLWGNLGLVSESTILGKGGHIITGLGILGKGDGNIGLGSLG